MEKKLILIIALLAITSYSFAQFKLSGFVYDSKTKSSLPGTHIIIKDTYLATSTNAAGGFTFSNLKKGEYVIHISYIGYETQIQNVLLHKSTELKFYLNQTAIMQEEVIVRAVKAQSSSPTTYTNIDKKDIEQQNFGKDIPFLIATTPSTVTSSDAGTGIGYTSIRVRGTDPSRINVTLNGIPLNDAESQSVFWVNIPDMASSINNIQVQRGVGTSTNGSAAFGASINIQTSAPSVDPYAELNSAGGSFRTFKNTLKFGTGLIKGRWAVDGRVSKITSDGYVDRAFSDLKSFFVSGGYYGEKTIFKINVFSGKEKTYQSWAGIPKDSLKTNRTYNPFTYENQTDNYQQDHYQGFLSHQFNQNWLMNLALHYTYGRGYYEEFQDKNDPWAATSFSHYGLDTLFIRDDTISSTNLVRQKWLDNDFYGSTFSINYKKDKLDILLGESYNIYKGRAYGEIIWAQYASNSFIGDKWYSNHSTKNDYNSFLKINYQISNKINLYGDLQYKHINYEINGTEDAFGDVSQKHEFDFFNPKLGINYQLNEKNNLYVSYAIANREPSRQNYIDASADMIIPLHETLYDLELGYKLRTMNFSLLSNIYYMDYNNQLLSNGEIDNVGYPILRNVKDSYRAGLEVALAIKILKNLRWDVNGTFSSNKIKNFTESVADYDNGGYILINHDETNISFSPDIIAGSILSFEPFNKFKIDLMSKYVGRQYIDNTSNNDRSLDPYLVNNLRFGYSFKAWLFEEIGFNFYINNILNEKYETNAWVSRDYWGGEFHTYNGYFPQAGINFMAGINLKL
ncbi:TonB-dependent receptor [Bacteroidota bacterium]